MTPPTNPRELVFATVFPDWHPRKGEFTFFPANILYGLIEAEQISKLEFLTHLNRPHIHCPQECDKGYNLSKIHTARKGHEWKVGDWFQPVTPDGVKICPPLQVTWVREFTTNPNGWEFFSIRHNPQEEFNAVMMRLYKDEADRIAANDGLSTDDFIAWFSREPFDGQLIGWTQDPYTNL